ncbi:MAG: hypothetical protein MHM6MM_000509 [Cercozoa sp. M6MM]
MSAELINYVDKRVSVITNDGRNYVGTLKGFDRLTNLVLVSCEERVFSPDADLHVDQLGVQIIRGDNLALVGEIDDSPVPPTTRAPFEPASTQSFWIGFVVRRRKSMGLEEQCVAEIRALSIDMVQAANSGHPGMPLGMAPAAHVLFARVMTYAASQPNFPNRDRFVLSNGHGCALLYSMLHLCGNEHLTMEQLKNFRQYESLTPGHPESHITPGVEVTTGPLGQGIAMGVGMAIARKHVAARFNKPDFDLINHKITTRSDSFR